MPTIQHHTAGTFCWWELGSSDLEAAWKFYHTLFRWEKRDQLMGPEQVYRICVLEGQDVGAMYQLDSSQPEPKVGPGWLPYVAVKSADESARLIAAAGGTLLVPPFDVMESGRMALFDDSEGARLAIWEPRQHGGADIVREVGTVCWNELAARNAERARRFYSSALGWKPELKSLGPAGDYTYWGVRGEPKSFAGMLEMSAEWGDIPPSWMTYIKVGDCDEIAAAARSAGGKVMMGPFEAPGVGRVAMLEDPTGGRFSVIRFSLSGR
jgi:predicted enzyme related to lactoylglutathione lyase